MTLLRRHRKKRPLLHPYRLVHRLQASRSSRGRTFVAILVLPIAIVCVSLFGNKALLRRILIIICLEKMSKLRRNSPTLKLHLLRKVGHLADLVRRRKSFGNRAHVLPLLVVLRYLVSPLAQMVSTVRVVQLRNTHLILLFHVVDRSLEYALLSLLQLLFGTHLTLILKSASWNPWQPPLMEKLHRPLQSCSITPFILIPRKMAMVRLR